MENTYLGALTGTVSALFAVLTGVLVKGIGVRFPVMAVNSARCTFAAFAFSTLWIIAAPTALPSRNEIVLIAASALLSAVVGDTAYFMSIRFLGISIATPIAKAYTAFAVLFAFVFLGEALTGFKITGVALSVLGTTLLARSNADAPGPVFENGINSAGIALALLAAVSWSLGIVTLRDSLAGSDFATTNVIRMAIGAITLWTATIFSGQTPPTSAWRNSGVMGMVVLTGICLTVSTACMVLSVAFSGAGSAAVYSSVTPLFSIPAGMILFEERMTAKGFAGCIILFAGVICVALG